MRNLIVAMMLMLAVAACSPNPPSTIAYDALPAEGDIARGQQLFNLLPNQAPPCWACHNETATASPDLTGYSDLAATRVEGESAREHTFYSITEPGRFLVEGYGNAMYNQYDEKLTPQDIADLIAYLLSL